MGECFEILNILVEVLVQGKGQCFKNTPKLFQTFKCDTKQSLDTIMI